MAIASPNHLILCCKSLFCTSQSHNPVSKVSPTISSLLRTPRAKTQLKPLCKSNTSLSTNKYNPHNDNYKNGMFKWRIGVGDGDDIDGGDDMEFSDYEIDDEDDNDEEAIVWKDYEVDYDATSSGHGARPLDFDASLQSESFVDTQGWKSRTVVEHYVDQDEFHKIKLLDCDFFIRKVPDPDNDVYDFREMYVTPPETDVYSIPEVVGKLPEKHLRLRKTDYGAYHTVELPMDHLRDPWYKTEYEVMKVFLMKHYKNKRADDPDFFLDLEEIYVIDSKRKSISRATVVVSVPKGKDRNRRDEVLIVRDLGASFKIIPSEKRDNPDVVIEKVKWEKSRKEMEDYLRSFRDYEISNWF